MVNNRKIETILSIVIASLLAVKLASASILDQVMSPFSTINFGAFYQQYWGFIDGVVYFILFLSLAQYVYTKVYKGKEGKTVAIAVGLALTFGMMVLSNRTGFNLGQLGPLAAVVFILILGYFLYTLLEDMFKNPKVSFSLTYMIMYAIFVAGFGGLMTWFNKYSPLLGAIITLANVVAFVVLLIAFFGMFGDGRPKPTNPAPTTPDTPRPTPAPTTPPAPTPPGTNAITISVPQENAQFNVGQEVSIQFSASGPDFSGRHYDYLIQSRRGDGTIVNVGARVNNMPGDRVIVHPPLRLGQEHVGTNTIAVYAYRRRLTFGENDPIAAAQRQFVVNPNPGTEIQPQLNRLADMVNILENLYRGNPRPNFVDAWRNLLIRHAIGIERPIDYDAIRYQRNAIVTHTVQIQQQIREIMNHAQYPRLTVQQQQIIANVIGRYTSLIIGIRLFNRQCIPEYNLARARVPLTTP